MLRRDRTCHYHSFSPAVVPKNNQDALGKTLYIPYIAHVDQLQKKSNASAKNKAEQFGLRPASATLHRIRNLGYFSHLPTTMKNKTNLSRKL